MRETLATRDAEVAELGPFRDQAARLARESENQTAAIASLEAKSEMWEGECASRDKRIKCAEDENATLKKNLAAVEKELSEIQKSARAMEKTLAEFHTKARGLVEAAPPPSEGRAAASATARLGSPGPALPPISDTLPSPPAGARFDPKATASAKKPGKPKGLGVSALRST